MSIASVIKYEGDNTTFIWKHPVEDFNTGSQLIVHESQEAVFFMNGQALDSFGAGRHTLSTQNMPLVAKYFNRVTGDETPFHCEVYFINKTEQTAIKWGTDSQMEYVEPTYGFPIKLGACGEMNLRVDDGRKLLIKIVGTESGITQNGITRLFRSFLMLKLKPYIVTFIRENRINIFQIDESLQLMSQTMHEMLRNDFLEYGIALEHFFINTVMKPENDPNYIHFKDLHFRQYADIAEAKLQQQLDIIAQQTEAQKTVIEAQSLAQKRSIEGYTYQEERRFDVAEDFANNESTGQFANMGIGMGMISGIGNAVGDKVGGMIQNSFALPDTGVSAGNRCAKCGADLAPQAKFCGECGEKCVPPLILCHACGKNVPNGKFCPECGAKLGTPLCRHCGAELTPTAKFCPECGQSAK